jgi:hypothetical protein
MISFALILMTLPSRVAGFRAGRADSSREGRALTEHGSEEVAATPPSPSFFVPAHEILHSRGEHFRRRGRRRYDQHEAINLWQR